MANKGTFTKSEGQAFSSGGQHHEGTIDSHPTAVDRPRASGKLRFDDHGQ
jgi:hypothetical protein